MAVRNVQTSLRSGKVGNQEKGLLVVSEAQPGKGTPYQPAARMPVLYFSMSIAKRFFFLIHIF